MSMQNRLYPHITEKGQANAKQGIYIFLADKKLNRPEIKKIAEKAYSVKVLSVRVLNQLGKRKRTKINRRAIQRIGQRSDFKKVFIRLKPGQKIKLFEIEKEAGGKNEG